MLNVGGMLAMLQWLKYVHVHDLFFRMNGDEHMHDEASIYCYYESKFKMQSATENASSDSI